MSTKTWQSIKTCYCEHAGAEVALEAQLVFPADWLPDGQGPRVLSHRCSQGMVCNLDDRPACKWAGTNPAVDPFAEPGLLRKI